MRIKSTTTISEILEYMKIIAIKESININDLIEDQNEIYDIPITL